MKKTITTNTPPKYHQVTAQLGPQQDEVLVKFKGLGGQRDRWTKSDWQKMAAAITLAEDELEYRLAKSRSPGGVRLAKVRRKLELSSEN
jgi:hypothetical protein